MREISSELEKRLEEKKNKTSRQFDSNNRKAPIVKRKSPAPSVPTAPKPGRPSQSSIKFNERAEVVEVEKTKRNSVRYSI